MKCPDCKEDLRTHHTYLVDDGCKTAEAKCPKCSRNYVVLAMIIQKMEKRGQGGTATASKIRKARSEGKGILSPGVLDSQEHKAADQIV